jgi:hypothetical protein
LSKKIVEYKTAVAMQEEKRHTYLATQETHGARKKLLREDEYRKSKNEHFPYRPAINERSH